MLRTPTVGDIVVAGSLITPGGQQGIPGERGPSGVGADGPQGQGAYTFSSEDFTIPELGETVDVSFDNVDWIAIGQFIYVENIGSLKVEAKTDSTLTLLNPIEGESGGGVEEAPIDGQIYGRRDASWELIPAGTAPPETGTEYTLGHVAPQFFEPSGGYTFGIMFSVSEDGYLKEVSWYKTVDEAPIVNHSFIIWDEAQVSIWNSPPDDDPPVEGWITHRFAIPMPLSAGNYRLGIYAANGYGTADAYYPHVDGPLSSESGCYIEGNGYPATSSVAFYCFDLVFAVSAGGGGIEEAPIDGKQYARQDASWTEVVSSKGGINYSIEEQDTGLTWIDGKQIYQKTIDFGVLPDNSYKEVAHNVVGLDQYIDIRGVIKAGSYFYTIPPASLVLTNQIDLYLNATMIMVMTGTAWNAATAFFTIQYTKTPPLPPAPVITGSNYGSLYYHVNWSMVEIYGSNFRDTDTLVIEGIDHSIVFISDTIIKSSSTASVGYPEGRDIPVYVRSTDGQVSNTMSFHVGISP